MSPASLLDDWSCSLVEARAGSADMLARLLEGHRPYLLQMAQNELNTDLQAKVGASDLVQESLLQAHLHFDQFQGGAPEELRGWLRQILLNQLAYCRRHYRDTGKRQLDREVPLGSPGQSDAANNVLADDSKSPSQKAIHNEQQQLLQEALARLPEHYRQVLVWRSLEQRSFEQIGQLLERSADAARMLWGRAVEALQKDLGLPS